MSALLRIAAAALAVLFLAAPGRAEMSADQKKEVENIVRDYLLANPEVLEEAFKLLQERREQAAAEKQVTAIEESSELIFSSKHQMVLGNPEGAITLVEFFDYNCGYCKRAVADMTALIKSNPDLRVVMKEFPILSAGSVEAARISVAIKDIAPEKYLEFHQEVFSRPGTVDKAKALEVATDLGLDGAAITAASNATSVTDNVKEVQKLAELLGITGTPSYIIGKEVVPGAVGYDGLQEKVDAMRKCGATACG
jgi:protein-disulfide isomerase